jgi:hypothetical protein
MKKRGGRRVQIKRIRFQIKQAVTSYRDPLPLFLKLKEFESVNKVEPSPHYKLIPLDFEVDYPNFSKINKSDPRYAVYKMRYLFGSE